MNLNDYYQQQLKLFAQNTREEAEILEQLLSISLGAFDRPTAEESVYDCIFACDVVSEEEAYILWAFHPATANESAEDVWLTQAEFDQRESEELPF